MLDIKTIYVMLIFIYLVSSATMFVIWRAHRSRYTGIGYWGLGLALQTLGYTMIVLRGPLSDFISIVIGNPLVFSGALVLLVGLERFFGVERTLWMPNALLIALSVVYFHYFSSVRPMLQMRSIAVSAMGLVLYGQMAWLLSQRISPRFRVIARSTAKFFLHFILAALISLSLLIFFPERTNDFFSSKFSSIVASLMLFALSAFQPISLVLTVNRRLNAEMEGERVKFDKTFYAAPYGMILSKLDSGIITEVNRNSEILLGYRGDELVGASLFTLPIWAEERDRSAVKSAFEGKAKLESKETRIRRRDASEISVLFSVTPIEISGEHYCISSFNDISEITEMRQRLHHLATHDVLTGLPNRFLFNECFKAGIDEALRGGKKLAVLIGDIDNFKLINDEFGHLQGDRVLTAMGRRLSEALVEGDMVARIGGDEYAVLFRGASSKEELLDRERRILAACSNDLRIGDRSLSIVMSIGCAMYPDNGTDQDMLMHHADSEMYDIKRVRSGNQLTCDITT